MACQHEERFGGVFGLPPGCGGCLACYTERISQELSRLYEQTQLTTEALQRFMMAVSIAFPHLDQDVASLLDRWNELGQEIDQQYKELETKNAPADESARAPEDFR